MPKERDELFEGQLPPKLRRAARPRKFHRPSDVVARCNRERSAPAMGTEDARRQPECKSPPVNPARSRSRSRRSRLGGRKDAGPCRAPASQARADFPPAPGTSGISARPGWARHQFPFLGVESRTISGMIRIATIVRDLDHRVEWRDPRCPCNGSPTVFARVTDAAWASEPLAKQEKRRRARVLDQLLRVLCPGTASGGHRGSQTSPVNDRADEQPREAIRTF